MAGIISCSGYVPYYRLKRDEISRAWGSGSMGGEKAVANSDEDSITMAVAAATNCLQGVDRNSVDRLFFATTTAPFKEKQCAALIAAAVDLPRSVLTVDLKGSLRSATTAIKLAMEAIDSGAAKKVLVTAADSRLGTPNSTFEQISGDGGVALLLGDSKEAAIRIDGFYSHSDVFTDVWRRDNDFFVQSGEDRFIMSEGYTRNVTEAVSETMKRYKLTPADFTKAIFYTPDSRTIYNVAKSLGFDAQKQLQDPLFTTVGNTGAAYALMMLAKYLESAKPGERALLVSYGDGCDVFILSTTERIDGVRKKIGMDHHITVKKDLNNYETYLRFRNILAGQMAARSPEVAYLPAVWRDQEQLLRFHALKCRHCGTEQFPRERVCYVCHTRDQFDEVRLSDKVGKVFVYSVDYLSASLNPPTPVGVIEFEGGCRFYGMMTDCESSEVELGMSVVPTFRKLHEAARVHNYYWKCQPVRRMIP